MAYSHKRLRDYLPRFLAEYERTSRRRGLDPNDRHYDRKLEHRLKNLPAEELDRLLRDEPDED